MVRAELYEKSLSGAHPLSFLVKFGSYYTYSVSMVKRYAVTLKKVCRLKVKVISGHAKILKSEHFRLSFSPIWLILNINSFLVNSVL